MDMENFKKEVEKLNQLVQEDEQGMGTWWMMLDERIQNIFKMYYGFKPSALNNLKIAIKQ